ncbi:sugar MFS transporter [Pedobacter heparinus]|uniref:Glucose/galactose transporter n=1 Tax=Pedobacter heparinus (strain ATCC 13125 / DSM 2366 / CIP 104194 / JCM 7457 / NBRC 12017 / NCIMB 9290 / NRRL B-14731 / HIM 762-3) TaxID=485917 RepID=C6Y2H4_PEDHD|nr:sugar MFS transporter [Pedobacter heparinus]ACU05184.1 glucose/galactose transporter [Pedobacter heparinus DSM 2366]
MALLSSAGDIQVSTEHQKGSYVPALISLAVLYFMMGFITVLNDTLVPFFKQGFTLTYSQSSLVQFYFFLTYGLMSIPSGKLVEKIGYKNGMVAGFMIASLGAFLFFPASIYHQYALFLSALFIVAIGIVLLQVAANPYITVLGKPETAASRLTLVQGIGSMGTTIAPVFGAHFILSRLHESNTSSSALIKPYLLIGAGLLAIGLLVWRLNLPSITTSVSSTAKTGTERKPIFSYRNLKYGVIALFMYVGAEVSIGTFLTNYISDTLAIPEHAANLYLSFYWGGMLVGRFVGAYFLKFFQPARVLAIAAALAASLIVCSVMSSGVFAIWCMVAVGLCNAIMFAVIFSLSVQGLGAQTTRASGLLSTAIVGGAVLSFAQGLIKDHYSWQLAFIIPVLCYLYIVFYGLNGYKEKS